MDAQRLQELLAAFPKCRIAVLGDFFLDKYLDVDGSIAEVSIETGKRAHQVVSVRRAPGAAGTVVNNLAALGAGEIHAIGFSGDDGEGYELRQALRALGCDFRGLLTVEGAFTPTYLKPRDKGIPGLPGEHERYDTKNRTPLSSTVQAAVLEHLERLLPAIDAVIVVDQVEEPECGLITARVRAELATLASRHPRVIFWADSRCRIGGFRGVTTKVNAQEAVREALRDGADAEDAAAVAEATKELARRTGKAVFVTAGARGIWVSEPAPSLVPAVRVNEPVDPTGAGDSATAGAVLALCAGATVEEAALVANLVASITIRQLATTGTATPSQLGPALEEWQQQRSRGAGS